MNNLQLRIMPSPMRLRRTFLVGLFFVTLAARQIFAQPPLPSLSINDVTQAEDSCQGKSFVFTVALSHLGKAPVTVNFATADGSPSQSGVAAVAGKDYVATGGTLTFDHRTPPNGPHGSFLQTVTVPLGSYVASSGGNDDRAFTVTLSGAVNASISKSQGVGTLFDAATSCAPSQDGQCFVNFCGASTSCRNVNRSATATPWCELVGTDPDANACIAAGLWRDTDNDGLSDAAEAQGYMDVNANGVFDPGIDVPLPVADPNKPDVYLHYDYVAAADHNHKPPEQAIQYIVDAFAAHGINLHIDPQHNAIDEATAQVVTLGKPGSGDTDPACAGPNAISVKELRAKYPALALLKPAYHYMVFAHYASTPTAGGPYTCPTDPENPACGSITSQPPVPGNLGTAEIGGNDSIVATQPFVDSGSSPDITSIPAEWWAGLGMHEFGHNFGLLHGGSDCFNDKPNYVGVMNYRFYISGIPVAASPGDTTPQACVTDADCNAGDHAVSAHCSALTHACFRIDYSDRRFNDLDENALNETIGLQGDAANTDISWWHRVTPAPFVRVATNGSPIDWNRNGVFTDTGVVQEVNGDGQETLLSAQNDWETTLVGGVNQFAHLRFAFQCSPDFGSRLAVPKELRLARSAWTVATNRSFEQLLQEYWQEALRRYAK